MDSAAFLTIVIILVSIILIAVGIYLILLLHEARKSLKRINNVLDRIESVADFLETKIARPAANFSSVFILVRDGLELLKDLKRSINNSDNTQRPQNYE